MAIEPSVMPRFTIDPREGTVAGPGGTVRLEPKVMEVLAVLSRSPGRVVSREELLDAVWPDVVVTEHTLSRCIYQLRHELGKIGGGKEDEDYDPIETLPKRGYRLLAGLETISGKAAALPEKLSSQLPTIPFIVGQWVRGDRFYGRASQIKEILDGPRNCIWLLGTRRVGKTSLLKHIELLSRSAGDSAYFPVFWDFQGADTADELRLNFVDALLDVEDELQRIGIDVQEIETDDLFASLDRLRRRLRERNLKLLLLCDEVEELIKLRRKDPSLLRKLRHTMQSRDDIRTVLASTIRLWALTEEQDDTSPFLHGFAPPLYLARLSDAEARSLIEQSHLGPAERPEFADGVVEIIRERCDNHPYLTQLVCKRYLECGTLEEAIEQVATDRMVSYFFSVDFGMLSDLEGNIIRLMARRSPATADAIRKETSSAVDEFEGAVRRLEDLGYVRRTAESEFELANFFFRRWLRDTGGIILPTATSQPAIAAAVEQRAGVDRPHAQSSHGLIAEMKRRSVFRVGFAYVAVSWALLQLAEISFEFLEIPLWAGRLLIVFLALGLPVALLLAWAFELTPEGIKRDRDVDQSTKMARHSGRKFDYIVIAILTIAVILFALDRFA